MDEGQVAVAFFLLVFALAIRFLLIGAVTRIRLLPGLPVASLMTVCPATAALILVYRVDGTAGAKALLQGVFDYRQIREKVWYAPILFLMPGIMTFSLGVMRWTGTPVPVPHIALFPLLLLCAFFHRRYSGRTELVGLRDRPDAESPRCAPGQYSPGLGSVRFPLRGAVAGAPVIGVDRVMVSLDSCVTRDHRLALQQHM